MLKQSANKSTTWVILAWNEWTEESDEDQDEKQEKNGTLFNQKREWLTERASLWVCISSAQRHLIVSTN